MLNFSADEYSEESAAFESSLDKEYRKVNGIFYTDLKLSRLISEYLKIDWEQTVFDPCCGTGSFLYAALEKGCKNVYGADLDLNALKLCRKLTCLTSTVKKN